MWRLGSSTILEEPGNNQGLVWQQGWGNLGGTSSFDSPEKTEQRLEYVRCIVDDLSSVLGVSTYFPFAAGETEAH